MLKRPGGCRDDGDEEEDEESSSRGLTKVMLDYLILGKTSIGESVNELVMCSPTNVRCRM